MLDLNKPVQTRDGRKARIICTDMKRSDYPIVALTDRGDYEVCDLFTIDGTCSLSAEPHKNNLINVPEKHTVYINMYPDGREFSYASREEADECAATNRIACVKVEYEKGQFDD